MMFLIASIVLVVCLTTIMLLPVFVHDDVPKTEIKKTVYKEDSEDLKKWSKIVDRMLASDEFMCILQNVTPYKMEGRKQ